MHFLFPLIFISSCSIFYSGKEEIKSAKGKYYSIHFGQHGWVFKKDNRSDYVFENQKDGRILLSNSFCGEFQDQPLEGLAKKTFRSVERFKPLLSEYVTFHNREAYELEGTGFVDGVKVQLHLLNTRRNNCYYDFVAITPKSIKEESKTFKDFLDTVVFR